MISIQSLLDAEIFWLKETGRPRWLAQFSGEKCELIMGNFPEEKLYTLVWRNDSIGLDDPPPNWTIPRN